MTLLEKKGKNLKSVFAILFALPLMVSAQMPGQQQEVKEDFSDDELERFVEVVKVQQEGQEKMVGAIEEEGLDIQTFNQILMAKQGQGQAKAEDIPADQEAKFAKASEKVNKLQQRMQQDMAKSLSENDLAMETYSQMMNAYQNSSKVQQEVDKLLAQQ